MGKSYKTAEACRVLDVQPYVLRYWETEFSALGGKKSGPQRSYSEEELQVLKRIKELLYDEGYTMGGAKKRLSAEMEESGADQGGSSDAGLAGSEGDVAASPAPKKVPTPPGGPKKASAAKKSKTVDSKVAAATSIKSEGVRTEEADQTVSLDTNDKVQIETTLLELRKLHTEATQILSLVRAAK